MAIKPYVIYIEDDDDDIFFLGEAFKHSNIDHPIRNFKTGLSLLKELDSTYENTCLFIVDMNMPGLNGIELIKQLKKTPEIEHIPIVVLSTGITSEERAACKKLGVSAFKKPLTIEELEAVIAEIMKHTSACSAA